jgi:hypothetical protein
MAIGATAQLTELDRKVELKVRFCTGGCEQKTLYVIFGVCNSVKTLSSLAIVEICYLATTSASRYRRCFYVL